MKEFPLCLWNKVSAYLPIYVLKSTGWISSWENLYAGDAHAIVIISLDAKVTDLTVQERGGKREKYSSQKSSFIYYWLSVVQHKMVLTMGQVVFLSCWVLVSWHCKTG